MDVLLSADFALVFVIILLTYVFYWMKNRGILPGPAGVPYLGIYPYLTDENILDKLEEYKKKYGDAFSFTYTGRLFINLGSIKAMREILLNKSDCFAEKYKDTNILFDTLGKGLTFVNGESWKVLRKFFILKFKEYGLNTLRDNMAVSVYDSLNTTIEDLKNLHGKPINIVEFLSQRSAVTMRRILFGEKGVTDDNLKKMVLAYVEVLEGNVGVNLLLIGPLARFLFATKPSFRKNFYYHMKMAKLISECASEIERSMNEEHPTCVIEEFFKERNKRRREKDPTWKFFSDEALLDILLQFVGDGIQSVAAFMAGIFSVLLEYPEEQQKLYSEMMEVIGPNRQTCAEDRNKLPYVNAFISEYIRHKSFLSFFPSLECTKESTINGYRIPVGSIILLNFRSAHHDPKTFKDPELFNPSRYMQTSGTSKAEPPVLFGMSKRSCFGEQFVMLQTFLFLSTIVKNFRIVASNAPRKKSSEPLLTGKLELTFVPRTEV